MVTTGLMVRLEAIAGKGEELASFLVDALPLVEDEPETVAWFALRAGESSFAIVDVFPDEAGRRAHLDGAVAAALGERAGELLSEAPIPSTSTSSRRSCPGEPPTMSTATAIRSRRELAHRVSGGIEVTLYWAPRRQHEHRGLAPGVRGALAFDVASEHALDAFHHPFAHLPTTSGDALRRGNQGPSVSRPASDNRANAPVVVPSRSRLPACSRPT